MSFLFMVVPLCEGCGGWAVVGALDRKLRCETVLQRLLFHSESVG